MKQSGKGLGALFLISLLLWTGCQEPDAGLNVDSLAPDAGDVAAPQAVGPVVTTAVVDRAGFDEVIAKHRGKVILVDFWATWCAPCQEQFPHTVEFSRKYDDQDLAVVSVSMDDVASESEVREFLVRSGATFQHLISSYGIGQEGFEAFELGDGGIPHYKIFDREGVVHYTTNDPNEIEPRIKELLNQG